MEYDIVIKFIYAIGISGSIVLIAVAVFKLLNSVTKNVDDLRKTVQNLGILSDGLVEDHDLIRDGIESLVEAARKIKNMIGLISDKVVKPFTAIFSFLKGAQGFVSKVSDRFKKEEE
jgi:hypothetical protein